MKFINTVKTEWLKIPENNYRKMSLLENFGFIDSDGREWMVPQGTIINGLSLPQYRKSQPWWKNVLYTVGRIPISLFTWSPYTSNARRASVIHDYECDLRRYPCDVVHKVFYEAMIADGTPKWQAKLFYKSVSLFEKW